MRTSGEPEGPALLKKVPQYVCLHLPNMCGVEYLGFVGAGTHVATLPENLEGSLMWMLEP